MAVAPAQFNVVLGFSETPLTQALESRNYKEALDYISNRYGGCFDDGYYRRIPLYIVLSGEKSCYGKVMPVHLDIAKRLIERGANPMLRIPESIGAEYIGPGRGPLECVVDLYNTVTSYDLGTTLQDTAPPFSVILMNGQRCTSVKDLIDDLLSMVWMLLGHGAEVNIRDIENKTPLHNTLIRSADLRLLEILCDNGANVNAADRCGNTPLMALCSPMPWRYYEDYGPSVSGYDISKAVFYLLRFDILKINSCGVHGRTALFYAMQSGNFTVARILLERGANPNIRGMGPEGSFISPLLASLIPWASLDRKDIKTNLKAVAVLVDEGFFSTQEILKEVLEYAMIDSASGDKNLQQNLLRKGVNLIQLLFGQRSSPLTQLAARTAVQYKYPNLEFSSLSSVDVASMVRSQGLPLELISHLQVVLLRDKILNVMSETDWDDWDVEEFSLNDSDDYDESDDEFW